MTDGGPGFSRRLPARLLTILGVVFIVVTILAGYLRWQAFDRETFETTAEQLIADDAIRARVADRTAEALLENVDVEALIAEKLPEDQQGLAGPLAATFAASATRLTEELYGRPRFQELWVRAAGETQEQVEKILDDDLRALKTVDGKLVLDLRPIVIELGDQVAIIGRAASVIPSDRTVIKLVDADRLEAAQDLTALFKSIAPWIWVVALACFALAIWLVAGRRREELRAIAIGLIVAGFAILALRSFAGNYLVNDLVPREEGKEAARNAWDIVTQLLADGAWSAILLGVVFLAGVIIAGPSRLGRRARSLVDPILRSRGLLYASLAGFLVLLAWWNPIAQTSRWLYMLVFAGLLAAGAEALRAVVLRENAAEPTTAS